MRNWLRNFPEDEEGTNLRGEAFRRLVRLCAGRADELTLMRLVDDTEQSITPLEEALAPWVTGTTKTDSWFGYGEGSTPKLVFRCPVTEGLLALLFARYDDIFLTSDPERGSGWEMGVLEDLCFFENGRLFFGSVSHETECFLWPLDEEMRREAERLDRWEPIDWRDERSRIALTDYDWTMSDKK